MTTVESSVGRSSEFSESWDAAISRRTLLTGGLATAVAGRRHVKPVGRAGQG